MDDDCRFRLLPGEGDRGDRLAFARFVRQHDRRIGEWPGGETRVEGEPGKGSRLDFTPPSN